MNKLNLSKLISEIESQLKVNLKQQDIPPQGMDSQVITLIDDNDKEYVVKRGDSVNVDIRAYEILEKQNLDIPVPKIYFKTTFENIPVLVMEKIQYPLLEEVSNKDIVDYLPSMINNLRKIHTIKSQRTGYLTENDEKRNWKDFHLSKFNGTDPYLKWDEISKRKCLDRDLVLRSVENFIKDFSKVEVPNSEYSLIHTDFNQRNLFVDTDEKEIAGIIDWGESMYGDPLYDFARIRMLLWHFNLGKDVVGLYYKLMNYSPGERFLDDLYWRSRVIEYLAYYSEELNEFNISRIKLHQKFLRDLIR